MRVRVNGVESPPSWWINDDDRRDPTWSRRADPGTYTSGARPSARPPPGVVAKGGVVDGSGDRQLGDHPRRGGTASHRSRRMAEAEAGFYATDAPARELSRRLAEAEERLQDYGRWRRLRAVFGLTYAESDLLALALAVAADPAFGRVCGYLQDDATACYATPLLAAALFSWPRLPGLGVDSALVRWRLARVPDGAGHPYASNAPWAADPYILAWLLGERGVDQCCEARRNGWRPADVARLRMPVLTDVPVNRRVCRGPAPVECPRPVPPVEIELIAPRGAGKRTFAAQLCAASGADLLVIDLESLPAGEPPFA